MAPPAGFATAWLRQLGLIVIALGLVLVVWRLGAPARAATSLAARPATVATMFGGALRPARSLRVAFGSPEGRALLVEGFTPTAEAIAPAGAELSGERGVLQVALDPDPVAMELVVLGRATEAQGGRLGVRVNETSAGELVFGPELTLGRLTVPGSAFVAERNRIELARIGSHSGKLTLVAAWLEPTSSAVSLDVSGSPTAAATLRSGWSQIESLDGRKARRVRSEADVSVSLHPLPVDYSLAVVGRSSKPGETPLEVGVTIGRQYLGELEFGAGWQPAFTAIPAANVPRSRTDLQLLLSEAGAAELLVSAISLAPLEDALLLDIGRTDARPRLTSGFSFDEAAGTRNGAWSEGRVAHVVLPLDPADEAYVLSVEGTAFHRLAPLSVRVELNGEPLGTLSVGADPAVHELPITRQALRQGLNDIAFVFARTMAPAQGDPPSTDGRELGVFFDWLELRPASRGAALSSMSAL